MDPPWFAIENDESTVKNTVVMEGKKFKKNPLLNLLYVSENTLPFSFTPPPRTDFGVQ